jgi:hypothetical protein
LFESPRQQLSESREVGLLVLGAAIAERHGREDEPDSTTPTRDGRDSVEPTCLTFYGRVKQKGVHLRYVRQRCVGQGLVQVGTMLASDSPITARTPEISLGTSSAAIPQTISGEIFAYPCASRLRNAMILRS